MLVSLREHYLSVLISLLQLSTIVILAVLVGFAAILLALVSPLSGFWVLPGISTAASL